MSFLTLGLAEPIARALVEEGYTEPTPIQSAAIPLILSGRDAIGIAQTGTGKTAAFALPILHQLAARPLTVEQKRCRVLVLSPTRELSGQIVESFRTYGRHLRLSVTLAIGGVPIGKQIRAMQRGVDVLVATPGRLIDLIESRAVSLDRVEVLVLDEADRMLDMGFVRDVRKIAAMAPKKRQTLLFSATMPGEIAKLAAEMLTNPATVSVTPPTATADRITQRAVHVARANKPALLAKILTTETIDRALVFARTKHGADRVVRDLDKAGIGAQAIHGNKSQGQRERTLAAFRSGRVRILIATDIAARGIDVDGVSHVVNYDLPNVPESYVHRIGRTARAGNTGIAISFCSGDEVPFLRDIEKLIRQQIPAEYDGNERPRAAAPAAAPRGERNERNQRNPRSKQRNDGNGRNDRNPRNDRGSQRRGERPPQHQARGQRSPEAGSHTPRAVDDIGAVGFVRRPARPSVEQTR